MALLSTKLAALIFLPLAYVVISFAYQVIYYRFSHPLRKFPGPFWASVTRLWITYHVVQGDEPQTFQALHKKYGKTYALDLHRDGRGMMDPCRLTARPGPVIRITPTMLLVSDATKLPDIYSRQANKSKHYITGSFGKTESLFNMQDYKQHARFRKVAAGICEFIHQVVARYT